MSQYNSTSLVVDDRDSGIVYSPGWLQVSSDAEFDHTKSGANKAGMTATFIFSGAAVEVYGSQGSYDVYGVPVSSYEIDALPDTRVQYTAPIIDPGSFTVRTLLYRSPPLQPGQHTLVITNLNGTQPSVYWLDYIVYTPSSNSSSSSSISSMSSSSSTTAASTVPTSSQTATAFNSAGSTKSHAGAIAGGVVGGVVFLTAVIFGLWWFCFHKRKRDALSTNDVAPFGSWPATRAKHLFPGESEKPASGATPLLQLNPPHLPDGQSYETRVVDGDQGQARVASDTLSSGFRLHEDSGVRMSPGQVVDIPPAYSDN